MLCPFCETIFTGGGQLSPGGHDEYFHHRSARSFKVAIAGGCQLCTMLREMLPEYMLTTEWEYLTADQEDSFPIMPDPQLNQPIEAVPDVIVPTYYPSKFYSRKWYVGRHGQNGGLKLDNPTGTTAFSLVYFRSDTPTGLPTVEFITVSSAGRAGRSGIGYCFRLRIMLFAQG